jgi:hypothetical protein
MSAFACDRNKTATVYRVEQSLYVMLWRSPEYCDSVIVWANCGTQRWPTCFWSCFWLAEGIFVAPVFIGSGPGVKSRNASCSRVCSKLLGGEKCASRLLNCFHIVGKCIKGVHCVRWSDETTRWLCLSAPHATARGNVGVSKLLYSFRIKCYQTL